MYYQMIMTSSTGVGKSSSCREYSVRAVKRSGQSYCVNGVTSWGWNKVDVLDTTSAEMNPARTAWGLFSD